ncbi:AbrB/MazE/SpoVT family DNA-binding domain-containing protein [Gracilibacillus oryzae]|uniref:AbrB/MazE/SpoVT family DNA-binding domain-containing protein n=1 Tax=Gracilibacillus oryzae TaxID=1672701 RepID=A0A7C8L241_9BACI|nr:AbrB/MazE/SpoVT family DNA-binding domain-containing protein [Gracilibacillus oryzae]KAB8128317.1 AbrB/MazE/SpoVT family DNA-binding domain-containing protein [Gracilibacillus oryzae]
METKIQKWGNSQAVRLPKAILELAGISDDDQVKLKVVDGNIVLSPIRKHLTLKERINQFEGAKKISSTEWDIGMEGDELL